MRTEAEPNSNSGGAVSAVIVGTGAMAPGIAAEYARLGPTVIAGRDVAKIDHALGVTRRALDTLAEGDLLDRAEADAAQARLSGALLSNVDFGAATVIVESIVED